MVMKEQVYPAELDIDLRAENNVVVGIGGHPCVSWVKAHHHLKPRSFSDSILQ